MSFYQQFNKYYDFIFPAGKPQLDFITKRIVGKKVLDLACGTGNYSIPLAQAGYLVTAMDLDEGMIEALREKAKIKAPEINALVGDMTKLHEYFINQSFQTIFCIGNSLVHLTSLREITETLRRIYDLLEENGILILQVINYDRILKYNIDYLPTIENNEVGIKLVRNYINNSEDGLIYFQTELIIEEDEMCFENTVALYPLKHKELIEILEKIGYSIKELYGGFKEEIYTDEAYATILVAEKR